MAKFLITASVLLICAGCAHTGDHGREDARYQRVEYFETVFLPASEACRKAGGFMIFEDPTNAADGRSTLSYPDMRLAIARGCGGI
jgi:hypothetical protein